MGRVGEDKVIEGTCDGAALRQRGHGNPLGRLRLSKNCVAAKQSSQIPTGSSLSNKRIDIFTCFFCTVLFCPWPGLKSFSPSLRAA